MSSRNSKDLRWGYTTGACAAAASKAALMHLLHGWQGREIEITAQCNVSLVIPVAHLSINGGKAAAGVVKDAGDDPDLTHGLTVYALVELAGQDAGIIIDAGRGVGRVSKPGLAVPVGEPAINPVPREMIMREVKDILPAGKGLKITIEVPEGEETAKKTFNPRLGIVGGISILGTTGLVRPMSREAYLESLIPQVSQAVLMGYQDLLLTPGGKGSKRAVKMGVSPDQVIQTSNFIGSILDACVEQGVKGVLLFGHLGKLVKVAAGIFQTHSSVADGRRETLAAHAALMGVPREIIYQIMQLNTLEASVALFRREGLQKVYHSVAEAAAKRCRERAGHKLEVGIMLYDLSGEILGWEQMAAVMGVRNSWRFPLK